jgi:hypothetical protein
MHIYVRTWIHTHKYVHVYTKTRTVKVYLISVRGNFRRKNSHTYAHRCRRRCRRTIYRDTHKHMHENANLYKTNLTLDRWSLCRWWRQKLPYTHIQVQTYTYRDTYNIHRRTRTCMQIPTYLPNTRALNPVKMMKAKTATAEQSTCRKEWCNRAGMLPSTRRLRVVCTHTRHVFIWLDQSAL